MSGEGGEGEGGGAEGAQPEHLLRDRRLLDDFMRVNNDLVNLQRELTRKNVELAKLSEQKNRVLGMVAHDLRSPLANIVGLSELLQEAAGDRLDAGNRELLGLIVELSQGMMSMVSDLLDVSAIEAGRLSLTLQPTDLGRLLGRNVERNRVLAARKAITVDLGVIPELPLIPMDAGKIDQVLDNLIGNAVKFSHRGTGVVVEVSVSHPEWVSVAVTDRGQGIPAAEIEDLFKPFAKGSVRGTANEPSTGLGLAIVRKVVEGHGGTIVVSSDVGKGSTFTFTLPLARDEAPGP